MINEISTTRDLTKITNNMGSEAYKKVVERNLSPTLKLSLNFVNNKKKKNISKRTSR